MTTGVESAPPPFRNRTDAGRAVAQQLLEFADASETIVLGLPRGGVVVAFVVAEILNAPCDVVVARKLGVPGIDEVAFGAIAEGSDEISFDTVHAYIGIPETLVQQVVARERLELARRIRSFRIDRALPSLTGKAVILVDDGMATGATMCAAARSIRKHAPRSITVAVPTASRASCDEIAPLVDRVVTVRVADEGTTVSDAYDDFTQVSDAEVQRLLGVTPLPDDAPPTPALIVSRPVDIPIASDGARMAGDFGDANGAAPHGLVIFAHGGGSSRHSYRNAFLAAWLQMLGWSTLRVDLLLPQEQEQDAQDGSLRFDLPRITERLCAAVDWAVNDRVAGAEHIILFGASTGASAALFAAAARPDAVRGVMSRAGRVDLAAAVFDRVHVPVLMIVGTRDPETLRGNRSALRHLRGDPTLKLVRDAGHTFEESGALGAVGRHVESWLSSQPPSRAPQSLMSRIRHTWAATLSRGRAALRG